MGIMNVIKKGSYYTLGEELNSALSHGISTLLAIAGTVILIIFSAISNDPWKMAASITYGVSLIILFLMSTLYHSLINAKAKKVFRIFDHTSIFLLIAGTYTPITLVSLRNDGAWGWSIFSIIWISAILGVVLNSISVKKFK
ncbi:MAG: hemolysin III family protein, partial [Oscillospiraceae bacterium]